LVRLEGGGGDHVKQAACITNFKQNFQLTGLGNCSSGKRPDGFTLEKSFGQVTFPWLHNDCTY